MIHVPRNALLLIVHFVGPINSQYVVPDEEQPRPHQCGASYLNYGTNKVAEALRWEHVHPALWTHLRFEAQPSSFDMPDLLPRLYCLFPELSLLLRASRAQSKSCRRRRAHICAYSTKLPNALQHDTLRAVTDGSIPTKRRSTIRPCVQSDHLDVYPLLNPNRSPYPALLASYAYAV